ncbi:hypothetical protein CSOJ01_02627 [Colletotrichum sojae]|uniref:Uncharacterized protein n=1 Tax=Colletotrichum sojae TaxID=2175907 RepID=A0A8H6JQG4_9PEZI|nr:hypothetical protein CSOJ01_02627 [Colletotrichum sojae]
MAALCGCNEAAVKALGRGPPPGGDSRWRDIADKRRAEAQRLRDDAGVTMHSDKRENERRGSKVCFNPDRVRNSRPILAGGPPPPASVLNFWTTAYQPDSRQCASQEETGGEGVQARGRPAQKETRGKGKYSPRGRGGGGGRRTYVV